MINDEKIVLRYLELIYEKFVDVIKMCKLQLPIQGAVILILRWIIEVSYGEITRKFYIRKS